MVEKSGALPHKDLGAVPVPRKPTPGTMQATPASPTRDRKSHDDLDHVMEIERVERERALLLARLQDAEQATQEANAAKDAALREASQLRVPTVAFPPASVPPPAAKSSQVTPSLIEIKAASDIAQLEKAIVSSRLGRGAIVVGVVLALAWNAFNSVRQRAPEQKVAAVQERLQQNERLSGKELEAQVLERERNIRRWRAVECWARQLRGASQRQGLDLPSLPPGGVTALKVGDEDPKKPGPRRFVAVEKCSDFPPLPPDIAAP